MCVLNGSAVARNTGPNLIGRAIEVQCNQPGMPDESGHRGREWAELESIVDDERWRKRPVFGPRVEVACAEHDSREINHRRKRVSAGEPHFDLLPTGDVCAVQTCRQCRGVIGDDQIAALQHVDERRAGCVAASRVSTTRSLRSHTPGLQARPAYCVAADGPLCSR